MNKGLKVLAWIVGVVVLILVAATVAIKLYLTKERVLAWVVPPLEKRLHRQVTIADVGAGLTGLHLEGLEIRAKDAPEALVSAQRVQMGWNLWSLLGGTVEILEVRLVEPRIHVVRLPDGTLSISDLLAGEEEAETPPAETEPPDRAPSGPPVDVIVRVFALQQGAVSYEDRSTAPANTYVLDGIEARVTQITLDGPIPYELSANLPLSSEGRFRSEGTVNLSTMAVDATVGVEDLRLTAWNELLPEGPRFASGVLKANLDLTLNETRRVEANGAVTLDGLELVADGVHGAPADISVRWQSKADLEAERASVEDLTLTVAEQVLKASLQATAWSDRPQIRFNLESEQLQLDPIVAVLPAAEEGAAEEEEAKEPGDTPAEPGQEPSEVPFDAEGDIRIAALRHGDLAVDDINLTVQLVDSRLQVDPVSATLYDGTLAGSAGADLTTTGPAFETEMKIEEVQIGGLLAGLSPKLKGALTGTSFLELSAQGKGGDLKALNSDVNMEVKNGKMVSHPLVQQFADLFKVKEYETLNFYSLKADAGTEEGVATVQSLLFSGPRMQATGKGTVDLVSRDLDVQLAVALPREVAERIIGNRKVLDALTDSEDWTRVPMRLTGELSDPSYAVDSGAVEKIATQLLEKKGRELLGEEALEKLPVEEEGMKRLEKGIRGLLEGKP